MQLIFTAHDVLPQEDAALVDAGLDASNRAAASLSDVRPLACFARSASGTVVGGAIGRTWGACAEVQQLWVDPTQRRQGIATRLVKQFEERAVLRGCRTFYVETFSFQAPALYRSLGYEVRFELRGFADGGVKYLMVREAHT